MSRLIAAVSTHGLSRALVAFALSALVISWFCVGARKCAEFETGTLSAACASDVGVLSAHGEFLVAQCGTRLWPSVTQCSQSVSSFAEADDIKIFWTNSDGEVLTEAAVGAQVWIALRYTKHANELAEIIIAEDDGGRGSFREDDVVASVKTTLDENGYGRVAWEVSWQGDDHHEPYNAYYAYCDGVYSGCLRAKLGSRSSRAITSKLSYDWGWIDSEKLEESETSKFEGPVRVTLLRYDRRDSNIVVGEPTWIVIHGRMGGFLDDQYAPMQELAQSVVETTRLQVLALDWSRAARAVSESDFSGEVWIRPVADWTARTLQQMGFDPKKIRLLGYSWGACVAAEIARRLGKVATLVVLDLPADSPTGSKDFNSDEIVLADCADESWAFVASVLAKKKVAASATHAFILDIEGVDWRAANGHNIVPWVFAELARSGPEVLDCLSSGKVEAERLWLANQYKLNKVLGKYTRATDGEFEGIVRARVGDAHSSRKPQVAILEVVFSTRQGQIHVSSEYLPDWIKKELRYLEKERSLATK